MTAAARILVVGAGSIGTRHAGNLRAAGAAVAITDPDPSRGTELPGVERIPFDLDQAADFDGVVIASPTRYHLPQAMQVLAAGTPALVEKPLSADLDGLDALVAAAGERVMVGYNLRLHEPIQRFMALFESGSCGRPLSVRVWFGSYLPAWRPAVDYRQTYSARSELGGGVLLDAIHELDLLVWMLGDGLEVVGAVVDRIGDLEIDVEDTVKALLRERGGVVAEVSLDYLSAGYRRGIEVIGTDATLRLDWSRRVIEVESGDDREVIDVPQPVGDSYVRQAERFLQLVTAAVPPPVDAATGAASVRLAHQIRQAAA